MKILIMCVFCGLLLMAGCGGPSQDTGVTVPGDVAVGLESPETLEYRFQNQRAYDDFFNGILSSHLIQPNLPRGTKIVFPHVFEFSIDEMIQVSSRNDVVNASLQVADRNKDRHITQTEASNFFKAQAAAKGGAS